MLSDKQIAANRQNAAKSTGPRSIEGKARVSRNAVSHGLSGAFRLLPGESVDAFEQLHARLLNDHKPEGESEEFLVRQIAELQLRIERATAIETELLLLAVHRDSPSRGQYRNLAYIVFFKENGFENGIRQINRYENSLRRSHLAALRELRQLQKARRGAQPQPQPPSTEQALDRIANILLAKAPPEALLRKIDKTNPIPPAAAPKMPPAAAVTPEKDLE